MDRTFFITSVTAQRRALFQRTAAADLLVDVFLGYREMGKYLLHDFAIMPEHFHALIWPSERADPSRIVQSLKEQTAKFMLKNLQASHELPWGRRMLAALTLTPTVHLHGPYRFWQRRFYDLNVWSEKKRLEKLNTMHGNPVQRGMVTSPDQWPWSSFRFYFLGEESILPIDRLP